MAQSVARGSLILTIDEAELEARLLFQPEPSGEEWNADRLIRLALESRIAGLSPRRAEDIVAKFARAKTPVTELLVRGQPPEQPVPEWVEWAELPVPEEMRGLAERLLEEALPPELYRVRTETVRVEKTVEKPAALPFLPPKIEKVFVSEKRESRERIHPDLELQKTGYAREGERLGAIAPARPGKAGKSIFGKPIQPIAEDGDFILGRGLERDKTEVVAAFDGLLRAGSSWAELIPLAAHRAEVSRSEDGATFLLKFRPGHADLPAPTAEAILAEAVSLGAPEASLLDSGELGRLIANAAASGTPIEALSLSTDLDATVEVRVDPDGLRASLWLRKGRGRGKPLELAAVSAALKEAGIKGLRGEELKRDVLAFYKGAEAELADYTLATGRPPTRGKDRQFSCLLSFLPEARAAELKARLAAHPGLASAVPSLGEFPLEEAGQLAFVTAGQRIGELSPPSPGQAGVDVRGNPIPGIPGNDPVIKTYENLVLAKGIVVASIPGLLLAAEREGSWSFRILPFRDSRIELGIAPDGMEAYLTLQAEEGLGQPLAVEAVLAACRDKGIVQGLDVQAVTEAVAAVRAGETVLRRLIARGTPPAPAGSVRLVWLLRLATGAAVTLGVDGKADYRNQDRITRVAAGDPVLRVERTGGAGAPGTDVFGKTVPPPAGEGGQAPPEHDASIVEEPDADGAVVYKAAVAGELLAEKGRITVRERLAVKGDLGPATGNVRFPGAVQVGGSVLSGYQLFSGGDVAIGGSVEAALVSAEGSVRINEGVKGHKRGTIRAKKGIEAAFAEQALLLAVEDIKLKSACLLCNAKTNGKVILLGDKGSLIGGLIRARRGVEAAILGSENGIKTEISFGQDYLLADMIETEEKEIEKVKAAILQADRAMADLERTGAGLDRIRQDKLKLMKLLEKRTLRLFDFREKFEEHAPSEIRIRGTIFPGVILESHNRFFEVKTRKTKVVFTFDPALGRIVERPLS